MTPVENRKKMNITIEFFILELVLAPIFSLNWKLQFSGPNLLKKGSYFQSKTDKIDTAIDFCIFEFVLVPSFSLSWQFWFVQIFNFDQKGFFWSKTEKVNTTYFLHNATNQISLVRSFSSSWQFWFFGPNFTLGKFEYAELLRKYAEKKQKKWTPHIFFIILHIQILILIQTDNFDFLDQIYPKRYLQSKTEKVNIAMEFCTF